VSRGGFHGKNPRKESFYEKTAKETPIIIVGLDGEAI